MSRPVAVSVVILTQDGLEHIDACLASLAVLDFPQDALEILVVDNASSDGTAEHIARQYPTVRVIRSEVNLGFSKGANLGAAQSAGRYVAFLNNDTRVDPLWLKTLVDAADAAPDLACVGSAILTWDGTAIDFVGRRDDALGLAAGSMVDDPQPPAMPLGETDRLFVSAGAALFRADVFRAVGGFDPDFFMYHEDVDLCWRLWLGGYRCTLLPASIVYHRGGASSGRLAREYVQGLAQQHTLVTLLKNLDSDNVNHLVPLTLYVLLERGRWMDEAQLAIRDAIAAVRADLASALAKRAEVQHTRVRSDAEIFARVGHPLGFALSSARYRSLARELAAILPSLDFDAGRISPDTVSAVLGDWLMAVHFLFERDVVQALRENEQFHGESGSGPVARRRRFMYALKALLAAEGRLTKLADAAALLDPTTSDGASDAALDRAMEQPLQWQSGDQPDVIISVDYRTTERAAHDREVARLTAQTEALTASLTEAQDHARALAEQLAQLATRHGELRSDLDLVRSDLDLERQRARDLSEAIARKDGIIREREEAVSWLQAEMAEGRRIRERTEAVNQSLSSQLDTIFNSRSWRWLGRYRRLKARVSPARRNMNGRRPAPPPPPQPAAQLPPPPPPETTRAESTLPAPAPPAEHRPADSYEALTLLPSLDLADPAAVLSLRDVDSMRRRVDVICFSIIDWEFRYQRPQQIMSQFAANGHRVFYLSTSRFRSDSGPVVRLLKENVYEVQLAARRPIDVYGETIRGEGLRATLDSLEEVRRTYDISSALSYVMLASWSQAALDARDRWHWPVIYDCMDEWENFPGISDELVRVESRLVGACDLLVVTADRLFEKWRSYDRPMVLARNGVDHEFYLARCRPNTLLEGMRHPIVGYCGAIAAWFDVDLLAAVAGARPQYQFVLIGGVFDVDVRALKALPNVAFLGQQPYATMPQYIYHFDVCLIPFKVNPTTEATDPVKLYEYLSAGKPVVSVALHEVEPHRDLIYLATGRDEFVAQLDRAVAEQDNRLVTRRREFAATQTWADRYARIDTALRGVMKRASIIIVTYNNLPLTKLCIESVLRNTEYPNFEIIVVDNASSDGTVPYLRYMEARHPEVHAILNAENQGFPRANNQGISRSQGDYVVLLNNDTIVPPGWLTRLINHLQDPAIGMVGPVTNFVGNEAKVETAYRTWAEMEHFAADRARRYDGQVADIHMLAMFCVAMRRETHMKVGPLDEQFGIGMFEDDDYAQRLRAHGYRVVCAADAFVHHVGQAAFKNLIQSGDYNDLFESNRRRYEAKWGVVWTAHRHGTLEWTSGSAVPK